MLSPPGKRPRISSSDWIWSPSTSVSMATAQASTATLAMSPRIERRSVAVALTALFGAVELGDKLSDAALDLVPGGPHLPQRTALRVLELPVDVALAWDVGALVAAAHRHHHVGLLGQLARDPLRRAPGQVDADLV